MAFDGTHIHIADTVDDDNVPMILPPSGTEVAPIFIPIPHWSK